MRVLKYVMEHIKTKGKNTLSPRLFVKTLKDSYKILELPDEAFENPNNRIAATTLIKYVNNNTETEICCFVSEARMGKIELDENMKEKDKIIFDGVTFCFQHKNDSSSEVMAFSIDNDNNMVPFLNSDAKDSFEGPFKHLF